MATFSKIPIVHKEFFVFENSKNNGILIIEWPELILPMIDNYWMIEINYADQFGRNFQISEQ